MWTTYCLEKDIDDEEQRVEAEADAVFLGCIECMGCRLLLPLIAVFVTRLNSAVQERINILFGVNTLGAKETVLDGGPDSRTARGGERSWGKFCPLWTRLNKHW